MISLTVVNPRPESINESASTAPPHSNVIEDAVVDLTANPVTGAAGGFACASMLNVCVVLIVPETADPILSVNVAVGTVAFCASVNVAVVCVVESVIPLGSGDAEIVVSRRSDEKFATIVFEVAVFTMNVVPDVAAGVHVDGASITGFLPHSSVNDVSIA